MTEGKAETTETTEKSPGDLAREKVAPEGYSWLTNYPLYTSEKSQERWLKDIQVNDPTIADIKIIGLAYDSTGELIKDTSAAYVKRKSPEESELESTESKPRQSFISRVLRRK